VSGRNTEAERRGILRVVAEMNTAIGSDKISEILASYGINLKPRSVRFHLKKLDQSGFTALAGRRNGRVITKEGRDFLSKQGEGIKKSIFLSRIDELIHRVSFSPLTNAGKVCVDVFEIFAKDYQRFIMCLNPLITSKLILGTKIAVCGKGVSLGGIFCPPNKNLIGVINAFSIAGIFLKNGIYLTPRLGVLVEFNNFKPISLLESIDYNNCSFDPLELFLNAKMLDMESFATKGNGIIAASLMDFPSAIYNLALSVLHSINEIFPSNILTVGKPDMPFLGFYTGPNRTSILIPSGLNALVLVKKAGIEFIVQPSIDDFAVFSDFKDIAASIRSRFQYIE